MPRSRYPIEQMTASGNYFPGIENTLTAFNEYYSSTRNKLLGVSNSHIPLVSCTG